MPRSGSAKGVSIHPTRSNHRGFTTAFNLIPPPLPINDVQASQWKQAGNETVWAEGKERIRRDTSPSWTKVCMPAVSTSTYPLLETCTHDHMLSAIRM